MGPNRRRPFTPRPLHHLFDRGVARYRSLVILTAATGSAVLFCDVDRFKSINDTYGHAAGDEALRALADRIRSCVRSDDICARMGGDELLVILDGVNAIEHARSLAEKIRLAAERPIPIGDLEVRTSLSIGVAIAKPGDRPRDRNEIFSLEPEQGTHDMTTFTNRRNLLWLLIGLITIEQLCSHLFNLNLLPGLTADAGMLLLWGIGHCDTMDGPVVSLGKKALTEKNVNFVLPWVRAEDEAEIRRAFEHAQAVRELGPQAMALADEHFLETLVRVHRAGEGAPYTGLKPAGLDIGPAVPAADLAIKTGSVDTLCTLLTEAVRTRLHTLFDDANTKKRTRSIYPTLVDIAALGHRTGFTSLSESRRCQQPEGQVRPGGNLI